MKKGAQKKGWREADKNRQRDGDAHAGKEQTFMPLRDNSLIDSSVGHRVLT